MVTAFRSTKEKIATALKDFKELTEQVESVSKVGNFICGVVGWKIPMGIDRDVENMKRKREELKGKMEDTESSTKAQLHPRKKVKQEPVVWLANAERVCGEMDNLESESHRPSSIYSRGFLKKNVCKKIEEADELLAKGGFDDFVVEDPSQIGQLLPTPSLVCETITLRRNDILGHLRNDEHQKIGIRGVPGVGKTTVIKLVNNELLTDSNRFDAVVWVTVSRKCGVIELQNKIAQAMNAVISEDEDETIRAGMLYAIFSQKGRYALILDDVWERFSLDEVGIPEPTPGNGSKLILTTRSVDVCRRMDCRVIEMEPLPELDAWTLFLNTVGENLMNFSDLVPLARSVAGHCAGLPSEIIRVARTMKGEYDLHIWRDTIYELNRNTDYQH